MTTPRDCRPPPNTPDGTQYRLYRGPRERPEWIMKTRWIGSRWVMENGSSMSVFGATNAGWRIADWTIAEPPHGQ